jgi:hypothetical protein
MKKLILLFLIVLQTITIYSQEKKSPLEGTWKIITGDPKIDAQKSPLAENGQIKTFSQEYFTFVGHGNDGTTEYESYGGGTYTLNGNKYEETILFHNDKSLINKTFKAIDEIKNDTLYHNYNSSENSLADSWDLQKGYVTEKYVRLR